MYNPWVVYGSPFPPFPGYYYYPPPGIFFGGLAIGFGVGIGIGLFAHWGWGWGHWGMGWGPRWGGRGVFYNHNTYITRSTTVINRGYGRPGGPGRGYGARGAYARPGGGFNRGAGFSRVGGAGFNRGASVNRGAGFNRGAAGASRPGGSYGRPVEQQLIGPLAVPWQTRTVRRKRCPGFNEPSEQPGVIQWGR